MINQILKYKQLQCNFYVFSLFLYKVAFTQCLHTTVCNQLSLSVDQDTASQNLWTQLQVGYLLV